MTTRSHRQQANDHLDAARASRVSLDELYAAPYAPDRKIAIADAHDRIRHGLKQAEVNALLAIADAIDRAGPSVIDRPIAYGLTEAGA